MTYCKLRPECRELHDLYIDWYLKKCFEKFRKEISFGDYCDILKTNGIHIL